MKNPFERRNKGLLTPEEEQIAINYAALRKPRAPEVEIPKIELTPKIWRDKAARARQYAKDLTWEAQQELLRDAEEYERRANRAEKEIERAARLYGINPKSIKKLI